MEFHENKEIKKRNGTGRFQYRKIKHCDFAKHSQMDKLLETVIARHGRDAGRGSTV